MTQRDAGIDTATAELGEVTLAYRIAGPAGGTPVVLLHGWPYTSYQWVEVMSLLAPDHRVVAPDLRGIGDSSFPTTGFDKGAMARDVRRLCHEVLGLESCHVVGHSWGNSVAYALAADFPGFVRSLAVLGPPPPGPWLPYTAWWQMLARVPDLPEELIEGRESVYFGWFHRVNAGPGYTVPADALAEHLRGYTGLDRIRAAVGFYRAMPEDLDANIARARTRLTTPSMLFMPSMLAEQPWLDIWRGLLADVDEEVFPDTGYSIPEERPRELASSLRELFARAG